MTVKSVLQERKMKIKRCKLVGVKSLWCLGPITEKKKSNGNTKLSYFTLPLIHTHLWYPGKDDDEAKSLCTFTPKTPVR